jgi:hypothetical protein
MTIEEAKPSAAMPAVGYAVQPACQRQRWYKYLISKYFYRQVSGVARRRASLLDERPTEAGHKVTQIVSRSYSMPSFLTRYRRALKLIPKSLAAAVLL